MITVSGQILAAIGSRDRSPVVTGRTDLTVIEIGQVKIEMITGRIDKRSRRSVPTYFTPIAMDSTRQDLGASYRENKN